MTAISILLEDVLDKWPRLATVLMWCFPNAFNLIWVLAGSSCMMLHLKANARCFLFKDELFRYLAVHVFSGRLRVFENGVSVVSRRCQRCSNIVKLQSRRFYPDHHRHLWWQFWRTALTWIYDIFDTTSCLHMRENKFRWNVVGWLFSSLILGLWTS